MAWAKNSIKDINEPFIYGIKNSTAILAATATATTPTTNAITYSAGIKLTNALTYIDKGVIKPITTTAGSFDPKTLSYEGYIRYNSKIVRWTEWFVQLQRITRLLMRNQLDWIQDPVAQGSDAISESITEYKQSTSTFNIGDYE